MKKIFLTLLAFFLIVPYCLAAARPGGKNGIYYVQGLVGSGAKDLDTLNIDGVGAPNTYDLIEGDAAIYTYLSGTDTLFSIYTFDASSTEATSSPDIIRPDEYNGTTKIGVWLLAKVIAAQLVLSASALPGFTALDSGAPGADKEIGKLFWNDDGVGGDGSEYGDFHLQTMYNGGEVDLFSFDASGNLITIPRPMTFGAVALNLSAATVTLPSSQSLTTPNIGAATGTSLAPSAASLPIGALDEETYIQADGIPDADDTFSCGMIVWFTAGDAVAQFDLVMMQTDGYVDQADATGVPIGFAVLCNDSWPATAETDLVGVCLIGSGGVIRNDAWTGHTAGEIVYVVDADGTAGTFDPADEIDLEDGDHWTAVGVMQEEDVIIFPVPAWATDDGT